MSLIDAILIIFLIYGAIEGIRKGAIGSLVSFIGSILVFILSWILKGTLANLLISKLPIIGSNEAISVLIYHVISFVVLLIIFGLIYKLILKVSGLLQKVLDATIVLGFVSRVIGAVLGFIKYYIYLFLILFILSIFNIRMINNSKVNNFVLEKTPLIAPLVSNTWTSIKEVYKTNNVEDNLKLLFEHNIINEDNLNKLLEKVGK